MIQNPQVLEEVRLSWQGVTALRRRVQGVNLIAFAQGSSAVPLLNPEEICFNLLLVHAAAVLNDVLEQLRDEGAFVGKGRDLRRLLEQSRGSLQWLDYARMEQMLAARNDTAHRGVLHSKPVCVGFLADIENQLRGWMVIE